MNKQTTQFLEVVKQYAGLVSLVVIVAIFVFGGMQRDNIGAANRPIRYVYDYINGFYVSGSQIFDASGNATLPGTLAVTGASTFTGAATFNGAVSGIATSTLSTLTVSGATSLATLTASATSTLATTTATKLTVSGATALDGGFTVDSTAFVVANTTGNTTIAGTFGVTGTSTFTGRLLANNVHNTFGTVATSTIQVGAASKAGCIILGDANSGANPVYITATGTTIMATTTKPSACQTAL